jgi:hypothetical protein
MFPKWNDNEMEFLFKLIKEFNPHVKSNVNVQQTGDSIDSPEILFVVARRLN